MAYTYDRRVTHCPFCGVAYSVDASWPRDCPGCGETHWANPLPVAVALQPVTLPGGGRGLVAVRRGIEPCLGELALPGGYMELGETWQEAVVRELWEETGLVAPAAGARLVDAHSGDRTLNLYAMLPPMPAESLPEPVATDETMEWLVIDKPVPLAFPGHDAVVAAYFAGAGATGGAPGR
ncbi:NUDIX domain-containing protein [Streptomyces sp. RFCAC02]|uniref:NUDIX domain-containing protein n=1 Tax=Streptomyces sp. RFCAC02 TaxID=2499143 RepID=UPI00101FA986|nr:NUDIX domain-containing protein [Streptomyces sp. RFCAC02]